jgi:hypothetical protein
MQHVNIIKDKNHMIISINAEKNLWQNSTSFHNKTGIEAIRNRRNMLQHNKGYIIYEKPIDNLTLNNEKLKSFPIKSETRQVCPLSPLSFSKVLEFLIRAIKQERIK